MKNKIKYKVIYEIFKIYSINLRLLCIHKYIYIYFEPKISYLFGNVSTTKLLRFHTQPRWVDYALKQSN